MNIVMAQIEVIPANPMQNAANIIAAAWKARKFNDTDNVEMVVFPELTIPGYLIGDLWEEMSFINECKEAERLVRQAAIDIGLYIVFGNVCVGKGKQHDGRVKKYNSLIIASPHNDSNEVLGYITDGHGDWFIPKILRANYREFEDPRHFSTLEDSSLYYRIKPITLKYGEYAEKTIKIGFSICEDGWDDDYEIKVNKILACKGAKLLVNCSCSPFTLGKNNKRNRVFGAHAKNAGISLIYVNAVGCQNNGKGIFVFDGSSVVYNSNGRVVKDLGMFKEKLELINTKEIDNYNYFLEIESESTDIGEAYHALVYGIKKYCEQSGIDKIVIGSSGGIDSSVSAALCSAAIGPENLFLVNMPSVFNSDTTKWLSYKLAHNLGCPYAVVPIQDSVSLTKNQIDGLEFKTGNDIAETVHLSDFNMENVQARDRSSRILAAIASGLEGRTVFTCNANKPEALVSYTTLYGDLAGGFAPLVDLWKTEGEVNVYSIGRYINKVAKRGIIPEGIFNIVASAELSNNQNVDEGKGDPLIYWYHDRLFKTWIQDWDRKSPEEILEWYLNGELNNKLNLPNNVNSLFATAEAFINDLEKWWKQFKGIGVVKRIQAPPGIVISKRSFGFDYRESLNCCMFTTKYKKLKEIALKK
jgi:NAD+ synthase (glutamine-hydrolysing)